MTEAAGSNYPLHPDQYGHPQGRSLRFPVRELWDDLPPLTDAQMEAMWAQEQEFRAEAARPHYHGDGHLCQSGACALTGGLKDQLCMACQMAEKVRR